MPIIAIVTDEMNSPHGTQMLAALVIDEAVRRGWRVVLFTAQYSPAHSSWRVFLSERAVRVFYPGFWRFTRHHLPHRVVAWQLWRYVRGNRPALVWSPTNDSLTCRALEMMPSNTVPFFVHDPNEASPRCPHYSALWFAQCGRVAGLSVHGRRQAENAAKYYNVKCTIQRVWPSSFPPFKVPSPPRAVRPLRFGQFGRLHSQKGALFSVAAFDRVRALGHDAELHFFGDGPQQQQIRELVDSLEVAERVFFHGRYEWRDLDSLMGTIDVGLIPSIYEGFGLVMLEIMSRGRPILSTDVGSSREILEEMGCGWVVRRADTEDLANAIVRCCKTPEIVRATGAVAKSVWETHFTPGLMFDRYVSFWRSCGVNV